MAMPSMRAWAQQSATTPQGAAAHKSAKDFLDVMEFQEAARAALPPAHWGIDCLPEVVEAVNGRIPVLVDGGFRRGTDIFKALALGAKAVGIGRPYIWGLSAFGQDGVERVLDILRAELTLTMRQMGAPTVREITRAHVVRASA